LMFKQAAHYLNQAGDSLNSKLENRYAIYVVMAVVIFIFAGASAMIGISSYSPDSWAYFELSKTVFSGDFYRFNTFRSYFSREYSASFPLGYPVAIALVSLLTGPVPMVAAAVNIVTIAATVLVLFNICMRLSISALGAVALIFSLLFYPPYFDEVFTGRAIPLALLVFLTACYFHLLHRPFISGFSLGIAALIRFDFLVFAMLFQIVIFILERQLNKRLFAMLIGFLVGTFPWVMYSYTHFGKFWVSDNSWVAMSALPTFVLNYPAEAVVTVIQDPARWLVKILDNTAPLSESILGSALLYPLLLFSGVFAAANWARIEKESKSTVLILVLTALTSTAPYLMTGYIDSRYFSPLLLFLTTVLIFTIINVKGAELFKIDASGLTLISLIITIAIGALHLSRDALIGNKQAPAMSLQLKLIETLKACHQLEPQTVYIFMKEAGGISPRYGAITGMRTAFRPSNFEWMNEMQKLTYLDQMKPYVLFDRLSQVEQCASR
jgi:hypothetical protein